MAQAAQEAMAHNFRCCDDQREHQATWRRTSTNHLKNQRQRSKTNSLLHLLTQCVGCANKLKLLQPLRHGADSVAGLCWP